MAATTDPERDRRRRIILFALAGLAVFVVLIGVLVVVLTGSGDDQESLREVSGEDLQTVSFEEPTETGEDPFTKPTDRSGPDRVEFGETTPVGGGAGSGGSSGSSGDSSVGAGPFGGTGSDLVCDRELLIESLLAQPERMRAWAGVLGIDPNPTAVSRYIRSLRTVTLTVDTRVTNHTFVDGRAVPLQSILAKGTAVLVDKYGRPVVRCRCGNPLLEPIFYPEATCTGCPPKYEPPPPCRYRRFRPWYPYPPEYLPPRWREPYPKDYPRPKYGVDERGRVCYVVYRRAPRVDYPPRWQPPVEEPTYTDPEYTITDRYDEPTYTEPGYEEPKHEPTYTEPTYTEPTYTEPTYTEPTESVPVPGHEIPDSAGDGRVEPCLTAGSC